MDPILSALEAKFRCEGVNFVEWNGLPAIKVSNNYCDATIALNGAHVAEFTPKGSAHPLLWMSKSSVFKAGEPLRGGIPVCWPWFGAKIEPSHGFLRRGQWTLEKIESQPDGSTDLALGISSSPATLKAWPYEFKCTLSVHLGRSLNVTLSVLNLGDKPFSYTGALHTYIAVSKITDVKVEGLEGVPYRDTVAGTDHVQEGPVEFGFELDRIYFPTNGSCLVVDPAWKRKIRVSRRGSKSAVIWNPWVAKSKRLADFGDEEYWGMLCVEAANAGEDVVTVQPGAVGELGTDIWME